MYRCHVVIVCRALDPVGMDCPGLHFSRSSCHLKLNVFRNLLPPPPLLKPDPQVSLWHVFLLLFLTCVVYRSSSHVLVACAFDSCVHRRFFCGVHAYLLLTTRYVMKCFVGGLAFVHIHSTYNSELCLTPPYLPLHTYTSTINTTAYCATLVCPFYNNIVIVSLLTPYMTAAQSG